MTHPAVISFDAAGTLFRPWPSVGAVYAAALQDEGIEADPAEVETSFRNVVARKSGQPRQNLSEASERRYWFEIVQATIMPWIAVAAPAITGQDDLLSRLFLRLWEDFSSARHWRTFDDVAPTLQALQANDLRVVVFSNADGRFHRVLKELELRDFFESVFLSAEIGTEKPHPDAFQTVGAELGVAPGEILHVGDSRRADFEGAQAAGWAALHLDRDALASTETTVRSLTELPERLGI